MSVKFEDYDDDGRLLPKGAAAHGSLCQCVCCTEVWADFCFDCQESKQPGKACEMCAAYAAAEQRKWQPHIDEMKIIHERFHREFLIEYAIYAIHARAAVMRSQKYACSELLPIEVKRAEI